MASPRSPGNQKQTVTFNDKEKKQPTSDWMKMTHLKIMKQQQIALHVENLKKESE